MGEFLSEVMLGDRSAIVTYDRGAGIGFTDRDVENDFKSVLKAYDRVGGTNLAQAQPRDPDRALQLIETYLRYQLTEKPRFSAAVIIDYGETVAPAGEPGQLPAEDRGAIVTMRRWASEPVFLQRNLTFCLLSETTAALSSALVADARTFEIAVPVPDEAERLAYLAGRGSRPDTFANLDARRAAILTAGLTRLHLESLLSDAEASGTALDQDALTREKKRLIEESSGGLLTFMTHIAGHEREQAAARFLDQPLLLARERVLVERGAARFGIAEQALQVQPSEAGREDGRPACVHVGEGVRPAAAREIGRAHV